MLREGDEVLFGEAGLLRNCGAEVLLLLLLLLLLPVLPVLPVLPRRQSDLLRRGESLLRSGSEGRSQVCRHPGQLRRCQGSKVFGESQGLLQA